MKSNQKFCLVFWHFAILLALLRKCFHYFVNIDLHLQFSTMELNPGPRKLKINSHWNLNSIAAQKFSKLTQLIAIFQFTNMISYASQTHLNSLLLDNSIDIEGCKLIRADHPDNIKRWRFYLLQGITSSSNHKSTLFKRSAVTRNELQ